MNWITVILASGFFFSLNHIIRKKILAHVNVLDMMIFTGSFGFLILLPFIKYVNFSISRVDLFFILVNAVFAFGGSYTLNTVYKRCEISTVSPLLNFNPVFVILLSWFILGEVLNSKQILGIFFILAGGYIVTLDNIKSFCRPFTSISTKDFLNILITLVLWSFCPVINKILLSKIDTFSYLFFFVMFIFLIQMVLMLAANRFQEVLYAIQKKWFLLIMASLCWIISDALFLYAVAIPEVMVSLLIPVKRISNLMTVVIGGRLFEEKKLLIKSTACAVMLLGLFVIGIYSRS